VTSVHPAPKLKACSFCSRCANSLDIAAPPTGAVKLREDRVRNAQKISTVVADDVPAMSRKITKVHDDLTECSFVVQV
jgi:hypothetical protein